MSAGRYGSVRSARSISPDRLRRAALAYTPGAQLVRVLEKLGWTWSGCAEARSPEAL
jgi:hypothetical protein